MQLGFLAILYIFLCSSFYVDLLTMKIIANDHEPTQISAVTVKNTSLHMI